MTEAEWLAPRHTGALIRFIEPKVSDRKLHCFDIACARRITSLLPDPDSVHGIDVLERFVEGQCGADDFGELRQYVEGAAFSVEHGQAPWQHVAEQLPMPLLTELVADPDYVIERARDVLTSAAYFVYRIFCSEPQERRFRDHPHLPPSSAFRPLWLVHEIFGNPFRPVKFRRAWHTGTVLALATQMYESRDFSAMPILADALQDAGCDSADILNHCRCPGEHARGCWVVDLVLGKQ